MLISLLAIGGRNGLHVTHIAVSYGDSQSVLDTPIIGCNITAKGTLPGIEPPNWSLIPACPEQTRSLMMAYVRFLCAFWGSVHLPFYETLVAQLMEIKLADKSLSNTAVCKLLAEIIAAKIRELGGLFVDQSLTILGSDGMATTDSFFPSPPPLAGYMSPAELPSVLELTSTGWITPPDCSVGSVTRRNFYENPLRVRNEDARVFALTLLDRQRVLPKSKTGPHGGPPFSPTPKGSPLQSGLSVDERAKCVAAAQLFSSPESTNGAPVELCVKAVSFGGCRDSSCSRYHPKDLALTGVTVSPWIELYAVRHGGLRKNKTKFMTQTAIDAETQRLRGLLLTRTPSA